MKLEFADEALERLAYDSTATAHGWSPLRLTLFRRTLFVVHNAHNVRDLMNMKSLAFRRTTSESRDQVSVRLAGGPRLVMQVTEVPPVAKIVDALDED